MLGDLLEKQAIINEDPGFVRGRRGDTIKIIKPKAQSRSRGKHGNRVSLRNTPVRSTGLVGDRIMNGNVPPNRGYIFKPSEDNNGRDSNFSKTSSRKSVGNNVEEFLGINGKTNSGFLLGSQLLRSKSNTQESLLSLAIRNTSDRTGVNVGTSIRAKDKEGFRPNAVGNRGNRQVATLLRNKGHFDVELRLRKGGLSKDVMKETSNGINSREGEGFKISHTKPVKSRRLSGRGSGNNLGNDLCKVFKPEGIRKNVSTNKFGIRENKLIPSIIQTFVEGVSGIVHFSEANSRGETITLVNFNRVRKGKGRFLDPSSNSAGPDIRSSGQFQAPVFDRLMLLFVDFLKYLRGERVGFIAEGLLKLREILRDSVGLSDSKDRVITSGGTLIRIKSIKFPAPLEPADRNRVIIKTKVRDRLRNANLGRSREFKFSSTRVFKMKHGADSSMTKGTRPRDAKRKSKLSQIRGKKDIINKGSFEGFMAPFSAK